MPQVDPPSIGADAWTGKNVSATPKPSVPLSSDMKPLSGKSVTSVPEEHRFDRVPPPAKNHSPKPTVPVDTYYARYNEMMERAGKKDEQSKPVPPNVTESSLYPPRKEEAPTAPVVEKVSPAVVQGADKDEVRKLVASGSASALLYDRTALGLVLAGRAEFSIRPDEDIYEITLVSKKDGEVIRSVGYASKSVRPN